MRASRAPGKIIVDLADGASASCCWWAAGLLIRTLRNLENTPLGMRVDGLVVFGVKPHIRSVSEGGAFYQELIRQAARSAGGGVSDGDAGRVWSGWSDNSDMMVDGKLPEVANGGSRTVRSNVVGPDFFRTLGVPVLAGPRFRRLRHRQLTPRGQSSTRSSPSVPAQSEPTGPRHRARQRAVPMTIVGVVKDHKYRSIDGRADSHGLVHVRADSGRSGRCMWRCVCMATRLRSCRRLQKAVQQMDPEPASDTPHDPARAI